MNFELDNIYNDMTYTELEQEYEKCKAEYISRFGNDLRAPSRDDYARVLLERMDKIFEKMLELDISHILAASDVESNKIQ